MEQKTNILRVKMFGKFSMEWNGRSLTGESKSSESQFAWLMEMILHHRQKGVTRDQLERVLFEDRDIDDVHHALRSVVYNAKKRLQKSGLPEGNLISVEKGVYRWNPEIPVEEDAAEMERLYAEAEKETDPGKKLALYLDACHCYTGEFLETQIGVVWIAREARRYREMFFLCVEKAVELMRESHDYFQMEALGSYASRLQPLENWETVTMEAMVSMGRYEDAQKLYEDTVELYFREQGLKPSDRLMELLDQLGSRMDHQYAVLDDIQSRLTAGDGIGRGGYLVSYPVFQGIYRMIERMMERGGQAVYLMLCTVVDSKGNPMKDGSMLEELAGRLEEAIRLSIRHSDTLTRYGRGQYLVLLINTTLENCQVVQKRINYRFIIGRQRTGIQYHVNSVICQPERKPPKGEGDRAS